MINNDLDPKRWKNNGFQGNIQFIPYVGRQEIRPGEKLYRDIQTSTFAKQNSKQLNTSQMARVAVAQRDFEAERIIPKGHMYYMKTMRSTGKNAKAREFSENPYIYDAQRIQIARSREQAKLSQTMKENLPEVRAAGLASINPTLGTSGSTPNLSRTFGPTGDAFLNGWRANVPPYPLDMRRSKIYEREVEPY